MNAHHVTLRSSVAGFHFPRLIYTTLHTSPSLHSLSWLTPLFLLFPSLISTSVKSLAKIKPTEPLRWAKQVAWRKRNSSDSSGNSPVWFFSQVGIRTVPRQLFLSMFDTVMIRPSGTFFDVLHVPHLKHECWVRWPSPFRSDCFSKAEWAWGSLDFSVDGEFWIVSKSPRNSLPVSVCSRIMTVPPKVVRKMSSGIGSSPWVGQQMTGLVTLRSRRRSVCVCVCVCLCACVCASKMY